MTGTAETEANEFHDIYSLDVVVIPTNRPCIRQDLNDRIYKTRREKYNAVIAEIKEAYARKQPVLVGTVSVEASELLSRMLKREKIPHNVLNARYHMQEAEIVSRAGQAGAITISTNMAGRGTDIKLGEGVADLGGLYVIGTERHESRRIDRQLRGRCSRQGDPGLSRFYVSFEDDLMRNFGAADRMTKIMERFGMKEGEELEHPWLNRSVETAQKRVEQRNYLMRRRTLEFDDVMNKQREVVYGLRNSAIEDEDPRKIIFEIVEEAVPNKVRSFVEVDGGKDAGPNHAALLHWLNTTFPLGITPEAAQFENKTVEEISDWIVEKVKTSYEMKVKHEEPAAVIGLERYIILNAIDRLWQEHLYAIDALREAVNLRAYGQKDPLVEYKNEAYTIFVELMHNIRNEVLHNLFRSTSNLMAFEKFLSSLPQNLIHEENPSPAGVDAPVSQQINIPAPRREEVKIGRNDPCPCGSGKKFKSCCGRMA
jgi:preprotein translocase subunit SecA